MTDPRISELRRRLLEAADSAHALYHQAYHKSSLQFYGLRAPQFTRILREIFPPRTKLERNDALALIEALRFSGWAEERWAATALLERLLPQLSADDVPYLKTHCDAQAGWGGLDTLVINVLSPLALREGEAVYAQVAEWIDDPHLWTRRAAILVHIVPARRGKLAHDYAWPAFAARLAEREFFIRKAIGWALRECCRHYPREVTDFVIRCRMGMSGLTLREATRKLPPELRAEVLG
jgi:3-methyladenine DNA glycosylase AlkD